MSEINIFITWSGEDSLSHEVAQLLHGYLPKLHDRWVPFLSSHDLITGVSWIKGLFDNLQKSQFGILCLTQDALRDKPWVYFEAGAIAMRLEPTRQESPRVVPLLIDLKPEQLPAPLSLFQSCDCDLDGLERLVNSLSEVCGFSADTKSIVRDRLGIYWGPFEESLRDAAKRAKRKDKDSKELPSRTHEDYLKEIVDLCRRSAASLDNLSQTQSQVQPNQSSPVQVVITPPQAQVQIQPSQSLVASSAQELGDASDFRNGEANRD